MDNNAPREMVYNDIAVGDRASFEVTVNEKLVDEFSKISGDMNPLHMDEEYARGTTQGKRIAHGMIVGALFSRLVGMHLPGKYSLYLSQTLKFQNPIALGTKVTIAGEVTHKSDAHKTITIRTTAEDTVAKKTLVSGEAIVQLLK
jgi:3-hydroxybutyryl-CoA dehydratase